MEYSWMVLFYTLQLRKQKKNSILHHRSIIYVGIVQIWYYPAYSTIQQTTEPWWAVRHYGGMALANQFIPPPGRGWLRSRWKEFTLIIGRRKKLICKLDDFILVFIRLPTLSPPRQWYCASPRAYRPAHILSILSSVADACFWLVVVWAVVDRRPSKGNGVFYIYFFSSFEFVTSNDWTPPPHTLQPPRASSPTSILPRPPKTIWLFYLPIKWRPPKAEAPFPLYFFDASFSPPKQVNQPSRRQTRSRAPCVGPEGDVAPMVGGADSLPMERGQSRWRVGWRRLMLVVVCYVCVLCVVVVTSPFRLGLYSATSIAGNFF
jgi:hypothetical protein